MNQSWRAKALRELELERLHREQSSWPSPKPNRSAARLLRGQVRRAYGSKAVAR